VQVLSVMQGLQGLQMGFADDAGDAGDAGIAMDNRAKKRQSPGGAQGPGPRTSCLSSA